MAVAHLSQVIVFPKGFPHVTAGLFLRDENTLVTGHETGLVFSWDLVSKKYSKICDCGSPIRAISCSIDKEIAIGCEAGTLVLTRLGVNSKLETLQEAEYTKHSRVWRIVWIGKDILVSTSTYGVVKCFTRLTSGGWQPSYLQGHSNSVFGAASSDGKFLVTGDYTGNIILWEVNDGNFSAIQKINAVGNIQDIYWYKDEVFAAITRSGRLLLFEKESASSNQWQLMYEIETATGTGNSVNITDDGKTIFAGTESELIQFDFDSQQTDQKPVTGVKKVFSSGDSIYFLTNEGFFEFSRKEVEVGRDLINYRFAKISLLGHTGTGKTTLCNYVISGQIVDVQSTFGKRVWSWILPKDNGAEKRIILSDYGGQEAVLETFLPFLKDSDMFLIFYKQTDKTTFEKALRILDLLSKKVKPDANVMLVQTFIDHEMNQIPETEIEQLRLKGRIAGIIKVSPKNKIGLDEFRERVLNSISWANTRIMIRSPFIEGITQSLTYVQEKGYPAVAYSKFKSLCQEILRKRKELWGRG